VLRVSCLDIEWRFRQIVQKLKYLFVFLGGKVLGCGRPASGRQKEHAPQPGAVGANQPGDFVYPAEIVAGDGSVICVARPI